MQFAKDKSDALKVGKFNNFIKKTLIPYYDNALVIYLKTSTSFLKIVITLTKHPDIFLSTQLKNSV